MTLKPIRFYQIPWSHFCDKVRWALDLKGLPYVSIEYNSFGRTDGLERAPKDVRRLMPIIEDFNCSDNVPFKHDSTPILLYLDSQYPRPSVTLFPTREKQSILDLCLRLDSELGPYIRRLCYVQLLGENPRVFSLFFREKYPWANNINSWRSRLLSRVAVPFLISRFRLHRIGEDHIREKTEEIILELIERLQSNKYLIGQQFTAADLTLCSLVRPLKRLPYFSDNRLFRDIFIYHDRIRQQYDPLYPNNDTLLDKIVDEHRIQVKQNATNLMTRIRRFIQQINFIQHLLSWLMSMGVKTIYSSTSDEEQVLLFKKKQDEAYNDQRGSKLRSKSTFFFFLFKYWSHYMFTMPDQCAYVNGKAKV